MLRALACLALLALVPSLHAEPRELPVDVSPCDLAQDPPKYNHKLVRVRGQVSLAFEDFGLYSTECPDTRFRIWLEFGGDVQAPTIYCCGDHSREPRTHITVEGFEIELVKDGVFYDFLRHLTAARKANPNGDPCYGNECKIYEVTATLVGRFFSGHRWEREDGEAFYMGYGHLGCCTLFAIQQVQDFEAMPTGVSEGEFVCSAEDRSWDDEIDSTDVAPGQPCGENDEEDCLASHLVEIYKAVWKDSAALERRQSWLDITPDTYVAAHYWWRSPDGLLTYKLELRRRCEKKNPSDECTTESWKPYKLTREACTLDK